MTWQRTSRIRSPCLPLSRQMSPHQAVKMAFLRSLTWLGMQNGGRNSSAGSVLGSLSCLMQCRGFDTHLGRIFPVEGIFPLELTWVLTPFPQNSFGWQYKPRFSLCTHAFHCTDSKDPDIHVLDSWMLATKTHPACTIHEDGMRLPQWLD